MWEWKETVERCFFTNHLDNQLKEFLNSQKTLSSNAERWEFIRKNAHEWEHKCSANFDEMMMPSFFGYWHISVHWGELSLPEPDSYTLEETLYWIFLMGWVVIDGYDKEKQEPCMFPPDLDGLLQEEFQYSLEMCTWLNKPQFLEEIKKIYNCSQEVLQYHQGHRKDDNSPWVCSMEPDCSKFLNYYTFCKKHLKNPEIVRLNKFEPDEYVWYLIRENSTLYFLRLCDFG